MFSNYYRTFDKEQITRVHEASLEVLQTTGMRVSHPLLAAAGARVESARERVSLPPQMVEDAVAQSPETFLCAGRSPEMEDSHTLNHLLENKI